MYKLMISVAAGLLLSGCAILETTPLIGTDEISRNIGDNAGKLNDAQSRALNGVILQNILRARDRWPKHYTILSGITSEPQVTLNLGAELTPIGLGNPTNPFGGSSISGSQDSTSALSYKSNPLERSDNAYEPIPHELFARYWNDGWPKDVLLLLLVKSISIGDHRYENKAGDKEKIAEYWRAAASLLRHRQCQYILSSNLNINETQNMQPCSEEVVTTSQAGAQTKLRYLSDDPCSREVSTHGNGVSAFDPDRCELKYVKRMKPRTEKECPVVESFGRLHLLNNRDSGSNGLLAQVEKLRSLYGNKVHLRRNKDSALGDVFEVRLCDSLKKDAGYEFVRLDRLKADEFFDFEGGKDFQDKQPGWPKDPVYSRWSSVRLELRSFDDILNYLGEELRTANKNGIHAIGQRVMKSSRCAAVQAGLEKEFVKGHEAAVMTNLFETVDKDLAEDAIDSVLKIRESQYAVKTRHAGTVYLAIARPARDSNVDCDYDRTSAVFALLSQIYIRSQSAAFLRAPEGGRVRTQ